MVIPFIVDEPAACVQDGGHVVCFFLHLSSAISSTHLRNLEDQVGR